MNSESMLITSGYNFEGWRITKYLGVFSGCHYYHGNGNDTADTARAKAISSVTAQAQEVGANAIIGLDVDYRIYFNPNHAYSSTAVFANGTAVRIERIQEESEADLELPVYPADTSAPLRPTRLHLCGQRAALEMMVYKGEAPRSVLAEIKIKTAYGQEIDLGSAAFGGFSQSNKADERLLASDFSLLADSVPRPAVSAVVKIAGVYDTSEADALQALRVKYGPDAICPYFKDESGWQCVCGTRNALENETCALCARPRDMEKASLTPLNISEAEKLSSAAEICRYISGLGLAKTEAIQKMLEDLQEAAQLEKAYGNNKSSALRVLQDALAIVNPPERITCPVCGFECTRDYAKARKKCPECGAQIWRED